MAALFEHEVTSCSMAGTHFLCSSAVGGYLRLQSQEPDHTGLLLVLCFKLKSDWTDFIVDRVGHSLAKATLVVLNRLVGRERTQEDRSDSSALGQEGIWELALKWKESWDGRNRRRSSSVSRRQALGCEPYNVNLAHSARVDTGAHPATGEEWSGSCCG